ncbi:MAG: hypothetical protein AB7G44_16005 [Bacteroidia bacterium]
MKLIVCSLFSVILFPFIALAQGGREGGPCSYETTNYPATIIEIFEVYEGWNDIYVVIKTHEPADTITWSNEFGGFISTEELKASDYKIGDKLNYQIKEIISGSCSPYIKWLTKERYKP